MARGVKQPPKKKHANKERPAPVAALSELEREFFADEAEQKAAIHLSEAIGIANWGSAPNAALHSAYYSTHFCAVAALYRNGGSENRKTFLRATSTSFATTSCYRKLSRMSS